MRIAFFLKWINSLVASWEFLQPFTSYFDTSSNAEKQEEFDRAIRQAILLYLQTQQSIFRNTSQLNVVSVDY